MNHEMSDSPENWVAKSKKFLGVAQKPENAGKFNVSAGELASEQYQNNVVSQLLTRRAQLEAELDGINGQIKVEAPKLEGLSRANLKTAAASKASADLKEQAGVTIPKPRTNSHPHIPTKVLATLESPDLALVTWDRNGNIPTAMFAVEKRTPNNDWNLVNVIKATKLRVPVRVGERTEFRIKARNGQGESEPSNEAIVYGG